MKPIRPLLALVAQLAFAPLSYAAVVVVDPDAFATIDEQLARGAWEPARVAAAARVESDRATLVPSLLAAGVARLAVAEAGAGRAVDALWHWQVAQNIDPAALSADELRGFGFPGELLARHPLRRAGAAPTDAALASSAAKALPRRKLAGDSPQLSQAVAALPAPKYLKVEVAIAADGALLEPVVLAGGVPGMIWEVLEGLRGWRYEPAAEGSDATLVLRELTFNPPANKPLAQVAAWSPALDEVDTLLRGQQWAKAGKRASKLWDGELDRADADPTRLAAALALRALAQAGSGEENQAICRWQAAQHLDTKLFDADLAPYGSAGELLARHRWGTARTDGGTDPDGPAVRRGPRPKGPSIAERFPVTGGVILATIVDRQGRPLQPAILSAHTIAGEDEVANALRANRPDPRRLAWIVAVDALDRSCEWTYAPPALSYQDVVALPFDTRPRRRPSPAPPGDPPGLPPSLDPPSRQ